MSNTEIAELKRHLIQELDKFKEEHRIQRAEDMKAIMDMLKPISDTYTTANRVAKWIKVGVVFAGSVVALLIGIKKLTTTP